MKTFGSKVKSQKAKFFKSKGKSQKAKWPFAICGWLFVFFTFNFLLLPFYFAALPLSAQSTEFTYQGRLLDGSLPPTANYDFQFSLWDSLVAGTQQGATQTLTGVAVANGIFTVKLNFGAQFTGAARFIQIEVRPAAGGGAYTTVAPRQQISSAPYAYKSVFSDSATTADTATTATNSLNLGGVAANQFVVTTDPRMSDARLPTQGSPNYIQNTTTQQAANFNVSGNGIVGGNLGVGTNPTSRLHVIDPGNSGLRVQTDTAGGTVASFGGFGTFEIDAPGDAGGRFTILENGNVGVGIAAPANKFQVNGNSSFDGNVSVTGSLSGNGSSLTSLNASNIETGTLAPARLNNAVILNSAGPQPTSNFNISGNGTAGGTLSGNIVNSATQYNIGTNRVLSVAGTRNVFVGVGAGQNNTTGGNNAFFGETAGQANTTGNNNTIIGASANVNTGFLENATAIGSRSFVTNSNSLVLGSINGTNGATADTNVGIGTTAPNFKLHVIDPGNTGLRVQTATAGGTVGSFGGFGAFQIDGAGQVGGRFSVLENGNVGIGTNNPQVKFHVFGQDARVEGNQTTVRPRFSLNFTGGLTDAKKWQNYATTNTLVFSALNDDETAENHWMRVDRGAGTTISNILFPTGNIGIGGTSTDRLYVNGNVSLLLASAGSTQVCQNAQNQLSTCSSSLKYKTNVARFKAGMSLISKLRPITFDWKDGGMKDVGFGAEDIAKIDPRFVTYNSAGEVEGVKYDRIGIIAVNAIKEQQEVISSQQSAINELKQQVKTQQTQIDGLKKLVCAQNPTAEICKEKR